MLPEDGDSIALRNVGILPQLRGLRLESEINFAFSSWDAKNHDSVVI